MKKGFTLIEVIMAIAMISLLILAISGITNMSIKMNLETSRRDESYNIATSICEIYKSNTDTYSNIGNEVSIYKYVNGFTDIHSLANLIESKGGYYYEANYNEIVNGNKDYKYTLILKIKRILNNADMEALSIEVVRNDGGLMKISMNTAK